MAAQQLKSSKTDFASLVCLAVPPALPLLVRFGRSAAQILQNGPRQLAMLGCAPCSRWWSVLAAQQPKSSKTDLASFVCLAVLLALPLVVRFGRSAARIFKTDLAACYAGLCSLLSLWWSVLAAQQPKSSKTDLASFVCLAVLLALPLSGGPFFLAAQQPESFKTDLPSSPGRPFWPLSSPNPSKRTSQACYAGLCSLLSLWWSVLAAQQPKSSKTDLPNNRWMCTARFEPSIFRLRVLPSAD